MAKLNEHQKEVKRCLAYPNPMLYTNEEVMKYAAWLLWKAYNQDITISEVFHRAKLAGFKMKSMSNNSMQFNYYGKTVRAEVSFQFLRSPVFKGVKESPYG